MPLIHARRACQPRDQVQYLSPPPSLRSTLPPLLAQDNSEQITAFPAIKIALKMLLLLQAPAALPPPPDPRPPAQDSCEPDLICSPDAPFSLSSFTLFPSHLGNDNRRGRNCTAPVGVLTVGISSHFEGCFGGHFDFFFHHEADTKTILNFDHLSQDHFALVLPTENSSSATI